MPATTTAEDSLLLYRQISNKPLHHEVAGTGKLAEKTIH